MSSPYLITVNFRDPSMAPLVVRTDGRPETTNPAGVIITEALTSYGDRRTTMIPWDLIESVVTE